MTEGNKISDNQHGARPGRSTIMQLLDQHDQMLECLGNGKNLDVVYLNFSKGYNLVDLSILLNKASNMGISRYLIHWLRVFLRDTRQWVRVGNTLSTARNVTSGVPRGSVLGL